MPRLPLNYRTDLSTGGSIRQFASRWWPLWIPVLVAAAISLGVWRFFSLHVEEPQGYSSAGTVKKYTGILPPPQASHIQTAGFSEGMVFSHYVRFEAPVDVCTAYATR